MSKMLYKVVAIIIGVGVACSAMATDFDPVAATNAYLQSVSAEDQVVTNRYVNTGYLIMVLEVAVEVLVAILLLRFGFSQKWRGLAERVFTRPFFQAFVYAPIYVIVTTILTLPLAWFRDFYVEHQAGLTNLDSAGWLSELLISTGFTLIGFSVFFACFYVLVRKFPNSWASWVTGLSVSFLILVMFIFPVAVAPAFNEYRPMDEGPLKQRILSIARANGMHADDIQQVDESKQTDRISANVSGLLGTARIALNDNLLNRASPEGVENVMAHEIGHYVLNHSWKSLSIFTLLLIAGFALASALFNSILKSRSSDWDLRGVNDYAGFPLLYAIGSVILFVATPLVFKVIYTQESEADLFAINATGKPDAWAESALMTAEYRKLHPPQWEENWLNHHPSPYARIYMAMIWKAENLSE